MSIHLILDEHLASGQEIFASLHDQTDQDFQVLILGQVEKDQDGTASLDDHRTVHLRSYRQQGFAKNHNQAIALALSRWQNQDLNQRFVVLADPATAWDARALEGLHAAFRADDALMIAGPTLLQAHRVLREEEGEAELERTHQIESQGWEMTRGRRWVPRLHGQEDRPEEVTEPYSVFAVGDACVMIRASALATLMIDGEVLDPDVPSGQEMQDLLWRAAWLQLKVMVVPSVKVWVEQRTRQASQDRRLLEYKNDDVLLRARHLPWILWERWGKRSGALDPERVRRISKKAYLLRHARRASREEMYRWIVLP